jgi:methionyl-tRNA formyltransferase
VTPLRLVFAGSPAAAVPSLRVLAESAHEVVAVITREDSEVGRRRTVRPTPVAEVATELGISLIKSNRLAGDTTQQIEVAKPDLGVIVAYGGLVREPLLSAPRLGWINLHFSLLPRWRGAAPVQWAIISGDEVTGASVFQLVPELDAGAVFATTVQPIGRHETAGHLLDSLAAKGAGLLSGVVNALANETASATPQVGEVTIAPKLSLENGRINWTLSAEAVANLIRGVTPEPGAFTVIDGARVKVLDALIAHGVQALAPGTVVLSGKSVVVGTASAPIELVSVLPAGKRAMSAVDWWRGRPANSPTTAE